MKPIIFLSFVLLIFINTSAQNQQAGPQSGNTFTTSPISGSSQSWINTSNAGADDGVYASFGNLPDKTISFTNYIVITNFNFSIPFNAIITGILVETDRADSNQLTADYSIRIVKGGSIKPTDRSKGAHYPATDTYQSYGGSSDLWGQSWSYSDINSSNFGVAIAAQRNGSGGTTAGGIDNVRITVYYTLNILPLDLIDFSSTKNNNSVLLSWTTSNETDMNHYEVERSADGINFNSIKSIASSNSIAETTYTYNDESPLPGTSYYRLLMDGNSGYQKFSPTISIQFKYNTSISLYPNPIRQGDKLFITNPNFEKLTIFIYDLSGKLVSTLTTNTNQINSESLQSLKGEFTYRVYNSKIEVAGNGKIIIQ